MRLIIEPNYQQLSCWAASYVAKKINEFKPTEEKPFVLGLPQAVLPLVLTESLSTFITRVL